MREARDTKKKEQAGRRDAWYMRNLIVKLAHKSAFYSRVSFQSDWRFCFWELIERLCA